LWLADELNTSAQAMAQICSSCSPWLREVARRLQPACSGTVDSGSSVLNFLLARIRTSRNASCACPAEDCPLLLADLSVPALPPQHHIFSSFFVINHHHLFALHLHGLAPASLQLELATTSKPATSHCCTCRRKAENDGCAVGGKIGWGRPPNCIR
jgi:hypothetical protein